MSSQKAPRSTRCLGKAISATGFVISSCGSAVPVVSSSSLLNCVPAPRAAVLPPVDTGLCRSRRQHPARRAAVGLPGRVLGGCSAHRAYGVHSVCGRPLPAPCSQPSGAGRASSGTWAAVPSGTVAGPDGLALALLWGITASQPGFPRAGLRAGFPVGWSCQHWQGRAELSPR